MEALDEILFTAFLNSIVAYVATTLLGAAIGFIISRAKSLNKRERARITIEKATARRLLFEAYDDYVIQKKHLTVDRFREITETYDAYVVLKGNGTAKKYYQEIEKINPYLVTD